MPTLYGDLLYGSGLYGDADGGTVPLAPSSGTASASLVVSVRTLVLLGSSSGTSSATLGGGESSPGSEYGVSTYGIGVYGSGPVGGVAGSEYGVSTYGVGVYGSGVFVTSTGQILNPRDLPPLRLHIDATTPNGRHYRWGMDEPRPANVPHGLRFSTSMPGGFDSLDVTLPRKTQVNYSDLDRLSTLQVIGVGGEVAGEYRLERAPRTSGNEMSVSPGAVGWQAHLEDDKSAAEVYVDRDLSHWEGMSVGRRQVFYTNGWLPFDGEVRADSVTGIPAIVTEMSLPFVNLTASESHYDVGSSLIGAVYYDNIGDGGAYDGNWEFHVHLALDDNFGGYVESSSLTPPSAGYYAPAGSWSVAGIQARYNAAAAGSTPRAVLWRNLAVYGDHGLTRRGTDPGGLYASDVIAHAVGTWAPLLNFTTGSNGTIQPSSFVIHQLEFRESTTTAEIVKQANRFHLKDWAVWEDKTFHYHDRGARGRRWRARIAPAQLSETGPQLDRLWNGAIVKFNDVDGTSKTVGPVGSGADTETAAVEDDDPENPVNRLGIRRWTELDMGGVSTVADATQVGQVFMEQSKLLDSSGQAQLVGVVEDDRGINRPSWQVRAGDYISFVDAADSSERRVVKTDYSHDSRTCSIDLDAPPEGMDALLERLGVMLVPLGL